MTALLSDVLPSGRIHKTCFLIVIIFVGVLFLNYYLTLNQSNFLRKIQFHQQSSQSLSESMLQQINNEKLALWPEDDPKGDRILAQLAIEVDPEAPIKTIYIDPGVFKTFVGYGLFNKTCNVQRCSITTNKLDMEKADAVWWRHSIKKSRANVRPEQIWILDTLESPFHQGFVKPDGIVNWTATYRRDSDIVKPYAKWVYYDNSVRRIKNKTRNYAEGKTKKVAMFVSNCQLQNNNRLDYAKTLGKYIEVDIYGKCGDKKCPISKKNDCYEMLQKSYKFYLAFENSNCRDYISEKFYVNGLKSDIIPVVMGAYPEDYRTSGPEHSYIHVDNFPTVRALAEYLNLLDSNDDLYNSYFEWRDTGEFIDHKFYCRLCAMLHTPRPPKTYENFKDWWNGDGICPPKSQRDKFLEW